MPSQEAFIDCPACGETVVGVWPAEDSAAQNLDEAPVAEQACTACGHKWPEQSPHWSFFTEAG